MKLVDKHGVSPDDIAAECSGITSPRLVKHYKDIFQHCDTELVMNPNQRGYSADSMIGFVTRDTISKLFDESVDFGLRFATSSNADFEALYRPDGLAPGIDAKPDFGGTSGVIGINHAARQLLVFAEGDFCCRNAMLAFNDMIEADTVGLGDNRHVELVSIEFSGNLLGPLFIVGPLRLCPHDRQVLDGDVDRFR